MDLTELQSTLQDERSSNRLQQLPDAFYSNAEEYIIDLREQREQAAEDAPNIFDSREVQNLSHKIKRAEETLEKIYNRRIGKIINQAVLAATGGTFDKDPLTETERSLYQDLIKAVEDNRGDALDVISDANDGPGMMSDSRSSTGTVSSLTEENPDDSSEPETDVSEFMGSGPEEEEAAASSAEAEVSTESSDTTSQSGGFAADVPFGDEDTTDTDTADTDSRSAPDNPSDAAPPEEESLSDTDTVDVAGDDDFTSDFETPSGEETQQAEAQPERADGGTGPHENEIERVTVQVREDVGEIYCVDNRTYDLQEDDVVTLPEPNAEPLLDRDAVVTVE